MHHRNVFAVLAVLALLPALAIGHPHFNKTVSAELPSGVSVKISYNITAANESRAENAAAGTFVTPRGPRIELSADTTAGDVSIPAGEYTIGVVKGEDGAWTMNLYPGRLGRGEQPDAAKLIKLDSYYAKDAGTAPHMLIDLAPGSGETEGKIVLTLHFGSMFLAGVIG
jgi:hypothetical protein